MAIVSRRRFTDAGYLRLELSGDQLAGHAGRNERQPSAHRCRRERIATLYRFGAIVEAVLHCCASKNSVNGIEAPQGIEPPLPKVL